MTLDRHGMRPDALEPRARRRGRRRRPAAARPQPDRREHDVHPRPRARRRPAPARRPRRRGRPLGRDRVRPRRHPRRRSCPTGSCTSAPTPSPTAPTCASPRSADPPPCSTDSSPAACSAPAGPAACSSTSSSTCSPTAAAIEAVAHARRVYYARRRALRDALATPRHRDRPRRRHQRLAPGPRRAHRPGPPRGRRHPRRPRHPVLRRRRVVDEPGAAHPRARGVRPVTSPRAPVTTSASRSASSAPRWTTSPAPWPCAACALPLAAARSPPPQPAPGMSADAGDLRATPAAPHAVPTSRRCPPSSTDVPVRWSIARHRVTSAASSHGIPPPSQDCVRVGTRGVVVTTWTRPPPHCGASLPGPGHRPTLCPEPDQLWPGRAARRGRPSGGATCTPPPRASDVLARPATAPEPLIPMPRIRPVLVLTAVAALTLAGLLRRRAPRRRRRPPRRAPRSPPSPSTTAAPRSRSPRRRRRSSPSSRPRTEMLLALGLQDALIGTAFADGPVPDEYAAAYDTVPVVSDKVPGQEALLGLEPDFVYGGWESNFSADGAGDRATLQNLGIAHVRLPRGVQGGGLHARPADVRRGRRRDPRGRGDLRGAGAGGGADRGAGGHAGGRAEADRARRRRSGTAPGRTPRTSGRASARRR